ncbi:hypothetical protein X758_31010 [Mesorhizobium sp. LSHC416B00]|nr:hypothetical protein X761_29855 [Mesorhizobium sp. LSHC424B00]ESX64866.1 hypothetical protein X758_31010 [Mesorhizobium sp. LSHC416B00]
MVQLASTSFEFILERLSWPVRLARLNAAREYARLLSDPICGQAALHRYLSWLGCRKTENEVCSGLAVLFGMEPTALPKLDSVAGCVQAPSVMAEFMLKEMYGPVAVTGTWITNHSGEAPPSFEPTAYFANQRSAQVPPSFAEEMGRLERVSGYPFMKQWAFEWQRVKSTADAPLSGFPYHFIEPSLERSGISAQIDQRQGDIFRSAYLRTLHCAVENWEMPKDVACESSVRCLPLNRGLIEIEPIDRPTWLGDRPDACSASGAPLESLVREILRAGSTPEGFLPVYLDIPLSLDVAEFATLTIACVLMSEDYVPLNDGDPFSLGAAYWALPSGALFSGPARPLEVADRFRPCLSGKCLPLCVSILPWPFGYWHSDLFQLGLNLPASYSFDAPISYKCTDRAILTEKGTVPVGRWRTWNDHWTPLYARGGNTRCGCLSEMRAVDIVTAADRLSLAVGWTVDLRIWNREKSYGELNLSQRSIHFLDAGGLVR